MVEKKAELLAAMRATIKYTDEVAKWETMMFLPVGVQLRDAYWQLEHSGKFIKRMPMLEDPVDAKGEPRGFVIVIPRCVIQPSPNPDRIRLTVIPENDSEPTEQIDLLPDQILYVTSLSDPPAGESRIALPS